MKVVVTTTSLLHKNTWHCYAAERRPHFSFIDKGVDRTRPASNGLNPAQVPFSLTNNQTVLRVKISRHRGAKEGGELRLHTCTLLACYP